MDSRTVLRILGTLLAAIILSDAAATAHGADVTGVLSVAAANAGEAQDRSRMVAFLDADPALVAPPKAAEPNPQIVQRGKAFVPDLLVVPQGTTVEFPNWDPFSHNVFSRSPAAQFDLDRYGQGQSKSV